MTVKQLTRRVRELLVGRTVVGTFLTEACDAKTGESISIPGLRFDDGAELLVAVEFEDMTDALLAVVMLGQIYDRAIVEGVRVEWLDDRESMCVIFEGREAPLQLKTVKPGDEGNGKWCRELLKHPLTNRVTRFRRSSQK